VISGLKSFSCDFNGEVELCQRESSTFISTLPASPALLNDDCKVEDSETFMAKAVKFSNIDKGDIDLISIDTEGSEWFVIKNMRSRPSIIALETQGGIYKNPYISEIKQWMKSNNYTLWYKNKSDSVYVLKDSINLTLIDEIKLFITDIKIFIKSIKKRISKKIKNIRGH
jgi:hypothetical protein